MYVFDWSQVRSDYSSEQSLLLWVRLIKLLSTCLQNHSVKVCEERILCKYYRAFYEPEDCLFFLYLSLFWGGGVLWVWAQLHLDADSTFICIFYLFRTFFLPCDNNELKCRRFHMIYCGYIWLGVVGWLILYQLHNMQFKLMGCAREHLKSMQ